MLGGAEQQQQQQQHGNAESKPYRSRTRLKPQNERRKTLRAPTRIQESIAAENSQEWLAKVCGMLLVS